MLKPLNLQASLVTAGILRTMTHTISTKTHKHSLMSFDWSELQRCHDIMLFLCKTLAEEFLNLNIGVVISPPTLEGRIVSHWVSHFLFTLSRRGVVNLYTEETNEENIFAIMREHEKNVHGQNVLVVNHFLTQEDTSILPTINAVRRCGGKVVGIGIIFKNNLDIQMNDKTKLVPLVNVQIPEYEPADCPYCRAIQA